MAVVTDPMVLEDINAALAAAVYAAVQLAEQQKAGLAPPPPADRDARVVLRRSLLSVSWADPLWERPPASGRTDTTGRRSELRLTG